MVNWFLLKVGRERVSISKRVKDKVKGVIAYINDFESNVMEIARQKGFRYVICGHIHQPAIKTCFKEGEPEVVYLNSGDWVENHTALEYTNGTWSLYQFDAKLSTSNEERLNSINIDLSMIVEDQEA
jgi:UDP-2,3-diacylglucosamine pyrophosphatase LpxH